MCYDRKKSTLDDPSFVAMKVQKSASHYRDAALDEIELLQCINEKMMSSIVIQENLYGNDNHIVRLVDHFDHGGPHGKHVCMVFEMLGENLLKIIKKYDYRGIPIPIVKNFVRQVCMGLDYLHRHCSTIHTDLKPENILVGLAPKPSDLEKVMQLVGNDKPMGNSSSTSTSLSKGGDKKIKKIKSAEIGELQEGIDKMSMEGGGSGGISHFNGHHNDPTIVKLTAEQKKKLKKKAKKKKQLSKKKGEGETKKGSSTGHRSRKGGHQRNNGETTTVPSKSTEDERLSEKEQEKLEMMLMELDSTPKEDVGVMADPSSSNHQKVSSETVPSSSSSSQPNKNSGKDTTEDENPDFGVIHEGEERMKMLRLSAFMHLNFESRADYEIEHHRHHSLHMQSKTIPKESYLPPPKPFLASLPMVGPFLSFSFCLRLLTYSFTLFPFFFLDNNIRTNDKYSWNANKYGS
jgi:hypothetical protein